jgi:ribose transport system substrate-binding protein
MFKTQKLFERLAMFSMAWAVMAVLGGSSAIAAEKGTLGVSMPTIQGPWYTALLYGVTDEAKKL